MIPGAILGRIPDDRLQPITQPIVAMDTLQDPPSILSGCLFYDGDPVNFDLRWMDFSYTTRGPSSNAPTTVRRGRP